MKLSYRKNLKGFKFLFYDKKPNKGDKLFC